MDKTENHNRYLVLNSYGWLILIMNIAFSIINITSICINFPRTKELDFDYLGIIVGILSLLVTVLVGWQIFINLSQEKKISQQMEALTKSLNEDIANKVHDISCDILSNRHAANAASLYQLSCSEYLQKKYDFALWLALDAMVHCSQISKMDDTFVIDYYNHLINHLMRCSNVVSTIYFLDQNNKKLYINSANKLGLYQIAYKISTMNATETACASSYVEKQQMSSQNSRDNENINNTTSFII